jgi:hypothetical protein
MLTGLRACFLHKPLYHWPKFDAGSLVAYLCPPILSSSAMLTSEKPKLVVEFRGAQAKFQGKAHQERVARVLRTADDLTERAVVDRDRLKVRAQL